MKKFLHFFIFVLILCSAFAVSCFAAENATYTDSNGITWKVSVSIDPETQRATATINGAELKERTDNFVMPSKVTVNDVEYTVTAIADNAFKVNIYGNLKDAKNNKGVYRESTSGDEFVRYVAENILVFGHLTLPSELETIGAYAFHGTAIYDKITIPASVTSIGQSAFENCAGILEVDILSESITSLPSNCFKMCNSMVTFSSAADITVFGDSCFAHCYALYNIDISENTLSVGRSAFYKCKAIPEKISLPNAISISDNAFQNCIFITHVNFGTAKFNTNALSGCTGLISITVSDEHPSYKTVDGILYDSNCTKILVYPKSKVVDTLYILDTVTEIASSTFENAKIKKVIFPSSLKTIGSSAFKGSTLETAYIPDSVTSVGDSAFSNCSALKWIIFGKGVTSFKENMVSNLSALQIVYYMAENPTVNGKPGGELKFKRVTSNVIASCEDHYFGYKDVAPTCSADGEKNCLICSYNEVIPAIGHSGDVISKSSLSCTTNESITINCLDCGKTVEVISVKAEGHDAVNQIVNEPGKPSYSYLKCSKCNLTLVDNFESNAIIPADVNGDGSVNNDDLDALGKFLSGKSVVINKYASDINNDGKVNVSDLLLLKQHLSDWKVSVEKTDFECTDHLHIESVLVHVADCIYGGLEIIYCTDCGKKLDEISTAALGHDFEYLEDVPASCFKEGTYARTCSRCKLVENGVYEKLEHQYSWWTLTDEFDYQYSYCKVCMANEIKDENGNYQLFRQKIDRSALDEMITRISEHYMVYYSMDSVSLIKPLYENAQKALTQEQVDETAKSIQEALPKLQYKEYSVPVVYLETSKGLNKSSYTDANVIVTYSDEQGDHVISDYEARLKTRGNSTNNATKYPFNIKFSKDVDLLGMGAGKKYILLANLYDNSLLRNAIAFEMAKSFGLDYCCQYRFVDVYVDGVYNGNYVLATAIEVDENRVDIDKDTDFILQYSESFNTMDMQVKSPIFKIWLQVESHDTRSKMNRESWSSLLKTMIQSDFALLSGKNEEIEKYFDIESMAGYYLLHEYAKNKDMIWDSLRFYIEDGKIHGGPAWDFDLSLGNVRYTGGNANTDGVYWNAYSNYTNYTGVPYNSATGTWADCRWAIDVYKNDNPYRIWSYYLLTYSEEFKYTVVGKMFESQDMITLFYEDAYDEYGKLAQKNLIDTIIEENAASILENYKKFSSISGAYSSLSLNSTTLGNGVKFNAPNSNAEAVDWLKAWLKERNEWLLEYYAENYSKYLPESAKK
ncbi:MAG: leucine-rich repeat protein [Clostridia bacterium]|nr:leucine-rich repeat protein [Clostridia bacterium]